MARKPEGLPWRRSWCVSTDKEFAPKAADVVGFGKVVRALIIPLIKETTTGW